MVSTACSGTGCVNETVCGPLTQVSRQWTSLALPCNPDDPKAHMAVHDTGRPCWGYCQEYGGEAIFRRRFLCLFPTMTLSADDNCVVSRKANL